jgi:hypothetical protein
VFLGNLEAWNVETKSISTSYTTRTEGLISLHITQDHSLHYREHTNASLLSLDSLGFLGSEGSFSIATVPLSEVLGRIKTRH